MDEKTSSEDDQMVLAEKTTTVNVKQPETSSMSSLITHVYKTGTYSRKKRLHEL